MTGRIGGLMISSLGGLCPGCGFLGKSFVGTLPKRESSQMIGLSNVLEFT